MIDELPELDKSAALARLEYWRNVYAAASATNDENTAAMALRYIQQYERLLEAADDDEC